MIFQVFATRDSAAGCYSQPMFAPATPVMLRGFREEVNNPQSHLFKYAGDFELFHLGEYDDATASFTLLEDPVSVCRAIDVKEVAH